MVRGGDGKVVRGGDGSAARGGEDRVVRGGDGRPIRGEDKDRFSEVATGREPPQSTGSW